jgi:hypothetical protein
VVAVYHSIISLLLKNSRCAIRFLSRWDQPQN